tara:strand:- start:954 stop:3056 length:2103 start_codon:yes stop_codon:yes gene_type:complete
MQTLHRLYGWPSIFVLLLLTWGLSAQVNTERLDTVDLDTYEVLSDYQFEDIQVNFSRSLLNENVLGIYGANQLQDMSGLAPNLAFINSDTRGFGDIVSMRGGANSIFFGLPSVGLYVDGVPGGSVSTYPSSLFNIASISLLSGPQSTFYGRNASSGMIDIQTRRPGSNARRAAQLEYGSYDARIIRGLFDGPMSDESAYSISFGYDARDGYIENIATRKTEDDRESIHGRANFFLNPSEDLEIRFGVFAEKVEDGATRLSSLFSPDLFEVSSNVDGITKLDRLQLHFQLRLDLDSGALTATTSYQDWDLNPSLTDLDLSTLDFGFSRVLQQEELLTQEFRFVSDPAASDILWIAGLFFFDSKTDGDATREFPVPPSDFVPPGFIQTEQTVFSIDQQNISAYVNAETAIGASTSLNAGVRIQNSESEIFRTKDASNNFGFPGPPEPVVDESQSETEYAGTVGIAHELSEMVDLIVRSSISQKPQGYSAFTSNPDFIQFYSEHLWSNEVGINFTSEESMMSGSLIAFFNDTDNYQFERTVPFSTDFVVVNAEKVSADGFEGKLVLNPSPGLFLDFQAGFVDATFAKHRNALGLDVSGNHVPFVPESTLRAGIRFESERGFFGSTSYTSFGKTYYDEQNQSNFAQYSFGIWDLQIGYRDENMTVSVYGRNLSDEIFYQFMNPEIQAGSPGAPKRFGLRMDILY